MTFETITVEESVCKLLQEWIQHQSIYHSKATNFNDAIDIEVERTHLCQKSIEFMKCLEKSEYPDSICDELVSFQKHLEKFKGLLMMEILRNGPNGSL